MSKILIIANSSIVFGKELKNELECAGYSVFLLDFEHLTFLEGNVVNEKFSTSFSKFKNIPKLSMLIRMYFILKVIKSADYDIVNIHYNRWFYKMIMPFFKSHPARLVISTYGSDFYRASDKIRRQLRSIYEQADAVTFTNEVTKKEFVSYYEDFENKSHLCRFGLKTLDYIDKNRKVPKAEMQKKLAMATDKIIVTCGYNATSAQQHFKIVESIEKLDEATQQKCQFVFPLTYGNGNYKATVIERLKEVTFDFVVLEDFLYEDDNAYVKLASDVMINMLETDSFSGSMQEFLYANNVVITGSWLPYKTFDEAGVVYLKIENLSELDSKLVDALENLELLKEKTTYNADMIAKLSRWSENIESWIKVFKGALK